MKNIDDKVKDWIELRKIINSVASLSKEKRHEAFDSYLEKGIEYFRKYGESFDRNKKPKEYDEKFKS